MKVIELNSENVMEWNKIVKSFKRHDVYYLAEYVKGLQIHGDGTPILFYFEEDGIRAMNVSMKRDIACIPAFVNVVQKNKYFDLITPYGYGGFLIEGTGHLADLRHDYHETCKNLGIVSEFVRFHPILGNQNYYLYSVVGHGRTGTLKLGNEEMIFENMSSSMRTQVRKLVKRGVEVHHGWSKELFDRFIPIYEQTMRKDNATDYYFFSQEYYDRTYYDLGSNAEMFYATYEGKIVSMAIIMKCGDQLHYHLAGTDQEYGFLGAAKLIITEAALWGSENLYKTLHLGGGLGGKEDELFEFKRRFNKNTATYFYTGRVVFNKDQYENLVSLRDLKYREPGHSGYFPEYRK